MIGRAVPKAVWSPTAMLRNSRDLLDLFSTSSAALAGLPEGTVIFVYTANCREQPRTGWLYPRASPLSKSRWAGACAGLNHDVWECRSWEELAPLHRGTHSRLILSQSYLFSKGGIFLSHCGFLPHIPPFPYHSLAGAQVGRSQYMEGGSLVGAILHFVVGGSHDHKLETRNCYALERSPSSSHDIL